MKSVTSYLDKIKNKTMLVVFPHPDDESVMAGGLIQVAMGMGYVVTVLTLTEGGRGKIHINGRGRSVSEIRRDEMARAMSTLGVADWIMWKFEDGKLRKTNKWRERLLAFLESTTPGVIVSYDLSGVSGHPDHIALSQELVRYVRKNDTDLLWPSFVGSMKARVVSKKVEKYLVYPKFILELDLLTSFKKWKASFSHRSQGLRGFVGKPWWWMMFVAKKEWYSVFEKNRKYKYRHNRFKI